MDTGFWFRNKLSFQAIFDFLAISFLSVVSSENFSHGC